MKRAFELKLADPNMPLTTALVRGGFVFPSLTDPKVPLSSACDTDGISLNQRRNQLLRRIRIEKQKTQAAMIDLPNHAGRH